MEKTEWDIPKESGDSINLSMEKGNQLFIVGVNGSGKSALLQWLFSKCPHQNIKWITAHRQTSLRSGATTFTPREYKQFYENYLRYNRNDAARYLDDYGSEVQSATLYDLENKYNLINESIANHHRNQNIPKATEIALESPSPFDQINELLKHGKLNVTLERAEDRSIIANHSQGQSFDIRKMSDGERSAMIIAAPVITAKRGTVFLIDEPEKHLHRSISEPFLTALFNLRKRLCIYYFNSRY